MSYEHLPREAEGGVKIIASPFAWLHVIDQVANLPFDSSSYKTHNVFMQLYSLVCFEMDQTPRDWFHHLLTLGPERINRWNILLECFIKKQMCRLLILGSSLLETINHVGQKITAATLRDWNFRVLHIKTGVSSKTRTKVKMQLKERRQRFDEVQPALGNKHKFTPSYY